MNDTRTSSISTVFRNVNATIVDTQTFYFPNHFITVFTSNFMDAMRGLTGKQRTVFDGLVTKIKRHNICRLSRTELAKICGMKPEAISKALSGLRKAGVIYKHHNGVFEIDPNILWWGRREEWHGHSSSPSARTHSRVQIYDKSSLVKTLWFPIIPAKIRGRSALAKQEHSTAGGLL
jgi:hypothetical protein